MTIQNDVLSSDAATHRPEIVSSINGAEPERATRFTFIDGLRGLAAVMVMFHHYLGTGAFEDFFQSQLGKLRPMVQLGSAGVAIFFVISGFVIAYSQRRDRVTPAYFGRFVVRRSLRLDPPYWVTILLMLGLGWVGNHIFHDRSAVPMPGFKEILAHLFYLPDFFGYPLIVPVIWTLCLEVQFYLVYTLLRGLTQRGKAALQSRWITFLLFAPLAAVSVAMHARLINNFVPGLFVPYWFLFFLGVAVCWEMTGIIHTGLLGLFILVVFSENLVGPQMESNAAILTAITIFVAIRTGKMETWLSGPVMQYLGRISYSIYLLHWVTGNRVLNLGVRLTGSNWFAWGWLILAVAVSILSAHLMYTYVERLGMNIGQRFKERRVNSDKTPNAIVS